ncbi:helix-turn-helix domain-containing protein [Roseibium algae]|uniref:Helix-turn-helix domain-containing protein n=1 Tax=Roseibium algae TaxID=3123038 RepID=A0ABU8TEA0_9HYPH
MDLNEADTFMTEKKPIPGFKFSTEDFRQEEQFGAWCDFTAAMCDLESLTPVRDGFIASAEAYNLGSVQLTNFEVAPMSFKYTENIIRKSGFDHWCLSVITKGNVAAESADSGFDTAAGGVVLHSYATPFVGQIDATNYSAFFFSRDDFGDVADKLDRAAHQQVTGPMSNILGSFLMSLENQAKDLTIADASAVSDAFGHLLRAMIAQTPATLDAAKLPIAAAQFDRARRFINGNLKSPRLTPETICAHLGVSRRQLYYLFEQQGGVAKFIRNRRLAACYKAIAKANEKMLISSIAYEYGFTNLSSFYRQFQAQYGFRPSEARSAVLNGYSPSESTDHSFVEWLLRADEPY